VYEAVPRPQSEASTFCKSHRLLIPRLLDLANDLQVSPLETATHLRRCDRTVKDAVSDFLSELYKRVYYSKRHYAGSNANSACRRYDGNSHEAIR
jgi:hypothetical protein